ncbi:hypothetical protein GPN2_22498 [Streptomyces murinus]
MLAYAYALKSGAADAEAAEVNTAPRAQRDTRAEAQLVASDAVLRIESRVNARSSGETQPRHPSLELTHRATRTCASTHAR